MNGIESRDGEFVTINTLHARRIRWLLLIAFVLFVTGIIAPMMTISKFVVVTNTFSVLSGVGELFHNGHYLLFLVVATFSIVLPLLKINVLYRIVAKHRHAGKQLSRYLQLMHRYGRWAMLDVMVVAVLIVTVKLGAIASIQVHYGLYVFGAAVLIIMLVTGFVVRLTERADRF
ncbi:MAG: paraquat-inducible protein A [Gammaproteobacteria bacterium]|jgi:paraquat-inducible protein A|nr:paraquat-inducible protein A [Gammaproteobacteria bacterium]MDH3986617.1 paraquat-inducible protein A [Gammaproteobacteria bacterium]